jgi:hypothetical protein
LESAAFLNDEEFELMIQKMKAKTACDKKDERRSGKRDDKGDIERSSDKH